MDVFWIQRHVKDGPAHAVRHPDDAAALCGADATILPWRAYENEARCGLCTTAVANAELEAAVAAEEAAHPTGMMTEAEAHSLATIHAARAVKEALAAQPRPLPPLETRAAVAEALDAVEAELLGLPLPSIGSRNRVTDVIRKVKIARGIYS